MFKQTIESKLKAGDEFLNWFNLDPTRHNLTDPANGPVLTLGHYQLRVCPVTDDGHMRISKC